MRWCHIHNLKFSLKTRSLGKLTPPEQKYSVLLITQRPNFCTNWGIQGRTPEEHMCPIGRNWRSTNQGVVNEVVHNPFLMPLSTSACITQELLLVVRLGAPVSRFKKKQDSWKEATRYQSLWIELSPSASTIQSLFQFLLVCKGIHNVLSEQSHSTYTSWLQN